ncbi:hypothetical protein EDD37DRAFT_479870 [Exophiala viscosa]|uniref:uncharacterized protein n=1 Tax=Exophiala viscosa TaxID=2486360 RepID=UPI00218E31F1|nr:hypothetical protein EDD37DRAFT_479870 [Exophiala viscosa]
MAQKAVPGLIMVPMSLKPELSVQECDEWYNNEHVPIRMRLPYFERGYRYHSIENGVKGCVESGLPEWLATYDILDMWELTKEPYTRLLSPSVQSMREHQVINKVTAWRKYYDLVSTYEAPEFVSREEQLRQGDADKAYGGTLIVVGVRLRLDSPDAEAEWDRWYEEDHLPPLRKVPGWVRTRRYRTSVIEDVPPDAAEGCSTTEYLTLNEFAPGAAIGGPEHQIAIKSESRSSVVSRKWRHSYELHYLQSSASRDLAALRRDEVEEFVSPDGLTTTLSGLWPIISSYITTRDKSPIKYKLEGVTTERAPSPVIVLCTWAGLSWNHWDGFVSALQQRSTEIDCRILRLELPVRVPNVSEHALDRLEALEHTANDLEDCSKALMIGKAALLLIQGLGGQTADGSAARVTRIINTESIPGALSQFCVTGAISVSHSRRDLEQQMRSLEVLAAKCACLADMTESAISNVESL